MDTRIMQRACSRCALQNVGFDEYGGIKKNNNNNNSNNLNVT